MNEETNQMDQHDDWQQIKGIGPSIAQALLYLGFNCYGDLADYTPERLADLLKSELPSISAQRIERDDWLGQAQALAQSNEANLPASTGMESDQDRSAPPQTGGGHDQQWREVADFFVSFGYARDPDGTEHLQTKVHHSQEDIFERWEGVATGQLLRWMLQQADLGEAVEQPVEAPAVADEIPAGPEAGPAANAGEPVAAEAAFLELADLWISEVRTPVTMPGFPSPTLLQAEGRLSLSGPAAPTLIEHKLPFTIEFYLLDPQTDQSRLVTTYSGRLRPGVLSYDIQQHFPVPPAGRYQLYLVARLLPPGAAVTHVQGPVIRVD
jgi:hypothetical protein